MVMWVPHRHALMATIHITRTRARLMATTARNGLREACSLVLVPGITAGMVRTVTTDMARMATVVDIMAADTTGRVPTRTEADLAMPVAELATPVVALHVAEGAAFMVVVDVAERPR
jgi:hypothetical protein